MPLTVCVSYGANWTCCNAPFLPLSAPQPIVHWGFIPMVLLYGVLASKPKPTLAQLLWLG